MGGIAFWILHPQGWWTGSDVYWLARWAGATKQEMKDAVLEIFVEGFRHNLTIIQQRGKRLAWLLWAVAFQTLCVVLVQGAWCSSRSLTRWTEAGPSRCPS